MRASIHSVFLLFLTSCTVTQPKTSNYAFRSSVLRDLKHFDNQTPSNSWQEIVLEKRNRCVGFRHSALDRCINSIEAKRPFQPLCKDSYKCRLAMAARARSILKDNAGKVPFRGDGFEFVMQALGAEKLKLKPYLPPKRNKQEGGVSLLYRMSERLGALHRHKVPNIGDLVFFNNTHDRNRNGRSDDPLTHIGIVERVDPDGTVTFIHRVRHGVLRYRMNLFRPTERKDVKTNKVLNHQLRVRTSSGSKKLTGELFQAFASVFS